MKKLILRRKLTPPDPEAIKRAKVDEMYELTKNIVQQNEWDRTLRYAMAYGAPSTVGAQLAARDAERQSRIAERQRIFNQMMAEAADAARATAQAMLEVDSAAAALARNIGTIGHSRVHIPVGTSVRLRLAELDPVAMLPREPRERRQAQWQRDRRPWHRR